MPDGADVTVPPPVPVFATVSAAVVVPPPPWGTNGERKLPAMTAWAMPGPCHDTAKLSPPVASLWRISMSYFWPATRLILADFCDGSFDHSRLFVQLSTKAIRRALAGSVF